MVGKCVIGPCGYETIQTLSTDKLLLATWSPPTLHMIRSRARLLISNISTALPAVCELTRINNTHEYVCRAQNTGEYLIKGDFNSQIT